MSDRNSSTRPHNASVIKVDAVGNKDEINPSDGNSSLSSNLDKLKNGEDKGKSSSAWF